MAPTTERRRPAVVIIGAGFGGLAVATELVRAGFHDFTILERAGEIGGVWRENTYPGAGCDIPSPLYSFSHRPNPDWPMRFSLQADIKTYLEEVAREYGLTGRIRFGTGVASADFDESSCRWRVRTEAGEVIEADVLVPAVGQLSRPALPDIPGRESFRGPAFHSASWDHDVELAGKRVAVIGTGASAIQFVPELQRVAKHVTVFQRSAPWIVPKNDVAYRPWHRRLFRWLPVTQKIERFRIWLVCEFLSLGLVDLPIVRAYLGRLGRRHLERQVPDRELRAKLTPGYAPGCKRALFSNEYYPALTRPNVTLETEKIVEILPEGVRTADGVVHEADVLVYGTGFQASDFLVPMTVRGRDGTGLAETWRDGAWAYLGITVPRFPNLFLVYGPNTNLGGNSIVHMLESQARYIVGAVRTLAGRPGVALDVKPEVAARFDTVLQRRLGRSVWTRCSSWYRNEAGRIVNNWPGTVTQYRLRTRALELGDYRAIAGEDGA
ncbi:NAD(P)/FAD-dependent oxidoreductase [Amycolatopsis endophytica]|uniref:Cation diffusion facilitator CzcD-associated flavoprotein CzcO n=1 Tax=Amycolatopsis endophytica TaxID=860233 RepID=A0A853B9S8_9PSEU|nr:NAD(P)/FAD-dependent oxidoreductase [Amycolatopsis endophytica]NYI91889.1 cation diffusion facilitator CzcD-associated flavoprotein CzcO [Amycolatopsis endophytica]